MTDVEFHLGPRREVSVSYDFLDEDGRAQHGYKRIDAETYKWAMRAAREWDDQ